MSFLGKIQKLWAQMLCSQSSIEVEKQPYQPFAETVQPRCWILSKGGDFHDGRKTALV